LAAQQRAWMGRRNFILGVALVTAGVVATGGVAFAGTGGGASGGGGVTAPKPPTVRDVSCLESCAGLRKATPGATVEISGRRLNAVDKVKFPSTGGGSTVEPTEVSSRNVEAMVPDDAEDGKPRVLDEFGEVAKSPVKLRIVPESELPEPGSFRLAESSVSPEKSYFFGDGKPTLHYIFNGNGPTDVRVDLVSESSGEVVESWTDEGVEPGADQTVAWNGVTSEGKSAKSGEYSFRLGGLGDSLDNVGHFGYYDHKFPIRGKHTYGDGVGAPRAGHTHQGQDVFADCGSPLEAARGGKVQFNGYHGAAGNYIVIDGKKTGRDYVYMHLKRKSEFGKGDRVKTGEQIGQVGETGNASGCHLHFEIWSPPGWYEGGNFLRSVTKQMKKWDRWS
jgi:murein DD-endopeptidase MepM/ murein hydrolase activator NlpD